ncbi:hypothetical protein OC845_005070 [Tilletia horrida]|nr:hypothetical protein OC845_005070 [Tilletia horrida]
MTRSRRKQQDPYADIAELFHGLSLDYSKIHVLQSILRALDIDEDEIPNTVTQCRKKLKTIHVNIYDLVPALKIEMGLARGYKPADGYDVPRYSHKDLRRELRDVPGRRFPLQRAKDETLRDLLRKRL